MHKHDVACAICGSKYNFSVLYKQNYKDNDFNIRIFSARRLPDKIHYQIVKCNTCHLVRSTPIIDNNVLNELYVDSKLTYDKEVDNLTKTYINILNQVLQKMRKNALMLEIGCGNGFVIEKLQDVGYSNVFGVEPSVDAVIKAPNSLSKRIINDYFKPGLFKSDTFELIFMFQTLDHIPNPNQFLKECYRILKPNGYIFAFNHDVESFSAKLLGEKSPIFDIEHTFLYSADTIKKLFKKNNFKINGIIKPASILSFKHLVWLMPFPIKLKKRLLRNNSVLNYINLKIPLGNLAVIATKK